MGKNTKAIAALRARLDPDLELIESECTPSFASGYFSLVWNNADYGNLTLAQYVKPSEISKVLDELPKWKYVAQSVETAYKEWQNHQAMSDGSMVYWKYSYSNTFQYRDIKHGSLWKREERIGDDWRYIRMLELPDFHFRGATSGDRKYYLPSGEEVVRSDWNQNQAWFAAVRHWESNN